MTRFTLQSTVCESLVTFGAARSPSVQGRVGRSGECYVVAACMLAAKVMYQPEAARFSVKPSVMNGPSTQIRRPSGEAQAPQMPTPHLVR